MKVEKIPPFEDFFSLAEESTKEALKQHGTAVELLCQLHTSFQPILEATQTKSAVSLTLLQMSSMMTWLAAIREASTGHSSASMPLFRASLEAACYGYRIWEEPDLHDIWMSRHRDDAAKKLCRRRFNSAVKDTAENITKRDFVWSGTNDWIMAGYENSIDFGAHPNPKSILTSLRVEDDRDDKMVGISMSGVFGSDSFEVRRLLLAGIEYGQLITLISSCCTDDPGDDLLASLQEINELKEAYVSSEFEVGD